MPIFRSKIDVFIAVICLAALFLLSVQFAAAANYDLYVDGNYAGDEDGSRSKPFNKISEAINAGHAGAKIFVKKSTYDERVILKKGLNIYGEDKNKVLIIGEIEMDDSSSISNLIAEGGSTAIYIKPDASAVISNCTVRKFGKIGIDASIGSGKVVVKNSNIYGGLGKGIYVERERNIEISGNSIYENGEEGIDVRAKVSGLIKNNKVYNNRESGIEIIIGSSEVLISGNNIKKNKASGIAAQFYNEDKKTGEIKIESNSIIDNKKYGLDCALPSGGNPNSSYWNKSINLAENVIESNEKGSINNFCKIIDVIEEGKIEEIKKEDATIEAGEKTLAEEQASKDKEALIVAEEKRREEAREEETKREKVKQDEDIWERAESIGKYEEAIKVKVNEHMDKVNSGGKFKSFFFGSDFKSVKFIEDETEKGSTLIASLKRDLEGVDNEETKIGIQTLIGEIEKELAVWKNFAKEKEKKKGMWGWVLELFNSIKIKISE